MTERAEYKKKLTINGRLLNRVVIDPHYKVNHPEINDELILNLVGEINGGNFVIESEKDGFQYFAVEPVSYDEKPYRLVLLLCLFDDYLGVVNAFRVRSKT